MIRNKRQMYDLLRRGCLGNHGPMWDTVDEWKQSRYRGLIGLRTTRQGGLCRYNVPPDEVIAAVASFRLQGYAESEIRLAGMAPEHLCRLRGEVALLARGMYLHYARDKDLSMRDSLVKSGQHTTGLTAVGILREALWPQSYDMLMEVMEQYDGHVIEFTAFSSAWGVVPHHNCAIWEVRNY